MTSPLSRGQAVQAIAALFASEGKLNSGMVKLFSALSSEDRVIAKEELRQAGIPVETAAKLELASAQGAKEANTIRVRSEEIRKSAAAETDNRIRFMRAEREPTISAIRQVDSIKDPAILKVVGDALSKSEDPEAQLRGFEASKKAEQLIETKRIRAINQATNSFERESKRAGIPASVIGEIADQIPGKVGAEGQPMLPAERIKLVEAAKLRAATVAADAAKIPKSGGSFLGKAVPLGIAALLGGLIGRSGGGGEQKMNPQLLMQLMQQQGASGGGQPEMNTSKTMIDMARLVSMLKNLQQLSGLTAQPAAAPMI